MHKYKILTLFLTRDASTFDYNNYLRVLNQEGIDQDVYVVSAKPVPIKDNIVVEVPQHLPVPIRIGLTMNIVLKKFDLSKYSHIFKVDGDISLPLDYCKNLLEKHVPVAGRGQALLISTEFFIKVMKGKYPINYCDDGYISALSIALGHWPPEYSGKDPIIMSNIKQSLKEQLPRELGYGYELYKYGFPFAFFIVYSLLLLVVGRKTFRSIIYNIAGYIYAHLHRINRYEWWQNYAYFRVRHTIMRAFQILRGDYWCKHG